MRKLLLLSSVWFLLVCGMCNNNEAGKTQTITETKTTSQRTTLKDSIIKPTLVGVGNSERKDTIKKVTTRKIYPAPGVQDEGKLDSLKRENDKIKK